MQNGCFITMHVYVQCYISYQYGRMEYIILKSHILKETYRCPDLVINFIHKYRYFDCAALFQ